LGLGTLTIGKAHWEGLEFPLGLNFLDKQKEGRFGLAKFTFPNKLGGGPGTKLP